MSCYFSKWVYRRYKSWKQAYGIQKAKDECRRLGRPPKLTAKEVLKAIELKQNNTSQQVANRFELVETFIGIMPTQRSLVKFSAEWVSLGNCLFILF